MERILELLRAMAQMLRSRYVRELEREVARLRAENRALLNSLLGTAGVPPLRVEDCRALPFVYPEGPNAARGRAARSSEGQNAGSPQAASARLGQVSLRADSTAAPPLRRRSW